MRDVPSRLAKRPEADLHSLPSTHRDVWGFAWEADEVARCLRDGKKESDRMPLRETVLMMQVFDEIRKQGRFEYPDHVERLDL